jgi:sugar phosphate isomerase/epimerase
MYETAPEAVEANRKLRYRWIEIARKLGACELRVDAGGTPEMPEEQFKVIVKEYRDVVEKGKKAGIPIVMENHWGSSNIPENVVKIMEAVPGLGLLFDTNNWAKGTQERGWDLCAKYAKVTHIKTFQFDAQGNDPSVDLSKAMKILVGTGYRGCFTVESCPKDGDEYGAVGKTFDLIRRELSKLNYS